MDGGGCLRGRQPCQDAKGRQDEGGLHRGPGGDQPRQRVAGEGLTELLGPKGAKATKTLILMRVMKIIISLQMIK